MDGANGLKISPEAEMTDMLIGAFCLLLAGFIIGYFIGRH